MKFAIELILIGLLTIGGIYWQIFLIDRDNAYDFPNRIIVPIIIGIITLVGLLVHGFIANLADNRSVYTWGDMFSNLLRALVLFISFTIKSYLGPIFTTLALIMCIYFLFEYNEFRVWKFVEVFFDWIFSKMPNWIEVVYTITLIIVAVGGSLVDSFYDNY